MQVAAPLPPPDSLPVSQVLHLRAPSSSPLRFRQRRRCEDPHTGSLADVNGQLSHCTHLCSACAPIQRSLEVALELGVDLCVLGKHTELARYAVFCMRCKSCFLGPQISWCQTRLSSPPNPLRLTPQLRWDSPKRASAFRGMQKSAETPFYQGGTTTAYILGLICKPDLCVEKAGKRKLLTSWGISPAIIT